MALNELSQLARAAEEFYLPEDNVRRRYLLITRLSRHYNEPSLRKTAIRMMADLRCYQNGRWRFDRCNPTRPYQPGGKAYLMRALMEATNSEVPSASRIAEILAGRKCRKV